MSDDDATRTVIRMCVESGIIPVETFKNLKYLDRHKIVVRVYIALMVYVRTNRNSH